MARQITKARSDVEAMAVAAAERGLKLDAGVGSAARRRRGGRRDMNGYRKWYSPLDPPSEVVDQATCYCGPAGEPTRATVVQQPVSEGARSLLRCPACGHEWMGYVVES